MATMKYDEAWSHAALAASDLTGKLHYLAKLDGDGKVVLCGSGDEPLGVIYEEGDTENPVTVMFGSTGKVKVGAVAIEAGARMQSDGNGLALTLAAGVAFGKALEDGAPGQIISFAFTR